MNTQSTAIPVLHLITGLAVGGAEKVLVRLIKKMDRKRFSTSVACMYNGYGPLAEELSAEGIHIKDFQFTKRIDPLYFWRLYTYLHEKKPVILHTWMFHANVPGRVAGRLAGIPIIISSERTMGQESQSRYIMNRLTGCLADYHICVSQAVAEFVKKRLRFPDRKIGVVPNGIDVNEFEHLPSQQEARRRSGLPSDQRLVGTVAQLKRVKRIDVLIRAMTLIPEASLVIVGDGRERGSLETLAGSLGLKDRVYFAGQQNDVRPWLRSMDVYALSSDWEGLPLAILEAMAMGLPVVATSVGGVPDLVLDGKTGFLVPADDPEALARALINVLRNEKQRSMLGEEGHKRVSTDFSFQTTVSKTEEIYETLVRRKLGHGRR